MKKIGILFGMENTFPPAVVDKINSMNGDGIKAIFGDPANAVARAHSRAQESLGDRFGLRQHFGERNGSIAVPRGDPPRGTNCSCFDNVADQQLSHQIPASAMN